MNFFNAVLMDAVGRDFHDIVGSAILEMSGHGFGGIERFWRGELVGDGALDAGLKSGFI